MRLFHRKGNEVTWKPDDFIPVNKFISQPPERYTKPQPQDNLDSEQRTIYQSILNHFLDPLLYLPVDGLAKQVNDSNSYSKLSDYERFWLSKECILRYLRATKWNKERTLKRIHETLLWRRQFGLDNYNFIEETARLVADENITGKMLLLGYDRCRQLVLILKNYKQNTEPSYTQVKQLVWFLEAACILTPKGTEAWSFVIDLHRYSDNNNNVLSQYEHPPLSLTKQVLNIVQDHYPERLYKCLVFNVPTSMWTFLKIIHPLINTVPRKKIIYDTPVDHHIESDQLSSEYGGKLHFVYDHTVYWPNLVETVTARKREQLQKFNEMGQTPGTSEYELRS